MIRKVCYLLFAFALLMFVSADSDITYSFIVGQSVEDGTLNYNPPFLYYLYDFLWILFAVLFVFFLFRTKMVSSFLKNKKRRSSTKKVARKRKKVKKKVARKKVARKK